MIELIKGNCLVEMQNIADNSIDMILCDLPYGTTACKWDTVIPFDKLWEQYERIIKPNGAIVLTASQPFTSNLIMSNPKIFKYEWTWNKKTCTGFMTAKKMPMKAHENILVFYRKQPTYNPQYVKRTAQELKRYTHGTSESKHDNSFLGGHKSVNKGRHGYELKHPNSVIDISGKDPLKNMQGFHPTQKPVALMEYLIKTYTNEGEIVLDNCMGSGTTGVACKNLNRNFIGIEKDDKYFDMAQKRINETQVQPKLF